MTDDEEEDVVSAMDLKESLAVSRHYPTATANLPVLSIRSLGFEIMTSDSRSNSALSSSILLIYFCFDGTIKCLGENAVRFFVVI